MAEILIDYLAEMSGRPFVYGADDCATFVLGWLDRAHGKAAAALWPGQYSDETTCTEFITRGGGFALIASAFFSRNYGLEPAPSRPGNPVFATFKGISAMGLRVDASRVALRTKAGLMITSRATVTHEWGSA